MDSLRPHTEVALAGESLTALSLIIPTFRRPKGLATALQSVFAQTGLETVAVRIIVCDNSPEASAKAQVAALTAPVGMDLVYLHEPNPGVANARNAAIAVGDDPLILFLDDDEEAPKDWVSQMLKVQADYDADVVFGPVTARLMSDKAKFRPYFEAFFSRYGPAETGVLDVYYGCGNSLIRRASLPTEGEVFSSDRNDCGGEDDKLFYGLQQAGAKIVWAADAFVYEDVPESRSSLSYTLPRAFAYGQGPSTTAMAAVPPKPLTCAYWMLNGLVQTVVFGIAGGVSYIIGASSAARILDKAARGAGKLIWFPPFKLGFYGTALLKANAPGR